MKNLRFVLLCTLILWAGSMASAAKVKPAVYADPSYPTKQITEINVLGTLDLRADTTLQQDPDWDMTKSFRRMLAQSKGYKVKYDKGLIGSFSMYKDKARRLAGKANDGPKTVEDSLMLLLTEKDLTDNRAAWLASLPPEVGNWVCVLVMQEATAKHNGTGVKSKAVISGYLFDREAKTLIWNDQASVESQTKDWSTKPGSTTPDFTPANQEREGRGAIAGAIYSQLLKSIPKKGKNFAPPKPSGTADADKD